MKMGHIDRRRFLHSAAIGATSMVLGQNITAMGAEQKVEKQSAGKSRINPANSRPNVVLIVSDDHRWDLAGCMGNPFIKTPNLDRLAQEGVLFENAFATSSLCSPSRGAILTGKYAFQAGTPRIVWTNNTFRAREKPFPARLHDAGYHSAHFGKWHLGRGNLGMPGYDHWEGFEWLGEYFDTELTINSQVKKFKGFSDDILSQRAAEYIKTRVKTGQPFCAFVGLKAPHLAFSYPPRHEHALDGVDIPKPDSFDEDYSKSGRLDYLKNLLSVTDFIGGIPMFDSWENYVKSYYRSVLAIDDAVGNILKTIDEAGIAENTIVIYTSDQGYTLGEHGLTEKHFAHEEAIRVPMFIRYPKMTEPGVRRKEMVCNIDIAPTVLDLCGLKIPAEMAGLSWRPLLAAGGKPARKWREEFFFETVSEINTIPGSVAVRTERYKLITYPWIDKQWLELYDLKRDPHEMKNLWKDPVYSDVLKNMQRRLERLKEQTGWVKVVDYPLNKCWVLSPAVPDSALSKVRDTVVSEPFFDPQRNKIEADGLTYEWKEQKGSEGHHRLVDNLGEDPNKTAFLAIPIELLSEKDPYILTTIQPVIRMKGYLNGRKYHDSPGGPGNVASAMALYNPPLMAKNNIFILEFAVRESIYIKFSGPKESIKLPKND